MTTLLSVPVLAVAMVLGGDAPTADAGGFSITIGGGGYGYGVPSYRGYSSGYRGYSSHYGSYNNGHRAYGPIVYPGSSLRYSSGFRGGYSQPHYDYHAPSLVPHRGHYHYQPGHYDLHYGRHGYHH
jgi:hypothetical protein